MLFIVKAKGDCFLFHNSYLIYVYNCFVHKHVQWEGSNPYWMNNFNFRHLERRYGLRVQGALKGGNIVLSHCITRVQGSS